MRGLYCGLQRAVLWGVSRGILGVQTIAQMGSGFKAGCAKYCNHIQRLELKLLS